jgi:hypothetical protein
MLLFRLAHRQKPLIVGGAQPSPLQTAAGTNIQPAGTLFLPAAEAVGWSVGAALAWSYSCWLCSRQLTLIKCSARLTD